MDPTKGYHIPQDESGAAPAHPPHTIDQANLFTTRQRQPHYAAEQLLHTFPDTPIPVPQNPPPMEYATYPGGVATQPAPLFDVAFEHHHAQFPHVPPGRILHQAPGFVMPPGITQQQPRKPVHRQIHRNRASYSCHSCRRRKVKCDRIHPTCGNCQKMMEQCIYSDNAGKGAANKQKNKKATTTGSNPQDGVQIGPSTSSTTASGISLSVNTQHKIPLTMPQKEQNFNTGNNNSTPADAFYDLESVVAVAHPSFHNLPPTSATNIKKGEHPQLGLSVVNEWSSSGASNSFRRRNQPSDRGMDTSSASISNAPSRTTDNTPTTYQRTRSNSPLRRKAFLNRSLQEHQGELPKIQKSDPGADIVIPSDAAIARAHQNMEYVRTMDSSAAILAAREASKMNLTHYKHINEDEDKSSSSSESLQTATADSEENLMAPAEEILLQPKYVPPQKQDRTRKEKRSRRNQKENRVKNAQLEDLQLALGHLSIQENERSRYVGGSFWALLSNETEELNEVLKSTTKVYPEVLADASSPSGSGSTGFSPSASSHSAPSTPGLLSDFAASRNSRAGSEEGSSKVRVISSYEPPPPARDDDIISILRHLPTRPRCEFLYRSFFNNIHVIIPLIHIPLFREQVNAFWEWYPENTHNIPAKVIIDAPTFCPLHFAVLYAAVMSLSAKTIKDEFFGESKESFAGRLKAATMAALTATQWPHAPTTNSLISYLLVHTVLVREEEPLTTCTFVGTAMRIAQQMGLHRDGSLFNLSPTETMLRRRIWWHIMHLDISTSIASGLPPLGGSSESQFDTKPISGTDAVSILAIGRYEASMLLRQIVSRMLGINPPRRKDIDELGGKVEELRDRMDELVKRIEGDIERERRARSSGEAVQEWKGSWEDDGPGVVFMEWAKIMLGMLPERAYGVLYQPLLKAKSRKWRHSAIQSSHSFLSSFLYLAREPIFAPFTWYLPSTLQPLHQTMILLVDLCDQPHSKNAQKSRAYIDDVFRLYPEHADTGGPTILLGDSIEMTDNGAPASGSAAWRMLGRLRKKAIRAGSESLVNRGWEQLEEGVIEGVMASPPGASDSGVGKEGNRSSLGSAEEHTHSPVAALSRKGVSGNEEREEKEERSDDAEEEEEYEQVAVKASESSHHQDNHHDQQHNAFHAPEVDLNFSFPESEWDTLLLGVDESVTVTDVDEVL